VDLSEKLNGLSLFTGIGGFELGLESYIKPVIYCEREPYCVAVLLERMRENKIPSAPICTDIRELWGDMLPKIDIITAGFPCQDVSFAGPRKGLGGERTVLFWEVVRLAKETSAPFVFIENVQGISKYVPIIRNAFEEIGYSCRDGFLSAADVGANHKRERWFLLAYANRTGIREQSRRGSRKDWKEATEPPPLARDWKGPTNRRSKTVPDIVKKNGGKLSPQFVEQLMAYPLEWTELKVLGTQSYQNKQDKRLKFYRE